MFFIQRNVALGAERFSVVRTSLTLYVKNTSSLNKLSSVNDLTKLVVLSCLALVNMDTKGVESNNENNQFHVKRWKRC